MPFISICVNLDTRPPKDTADGLFSGTANEDFLIDGLRGKLKAFDGFDTELIVFVDEHLPIHENILSEMRLMCQTIVIRKHTSENKFNDNNYLACLSMARGEYVVHLDSDSNIFISSPNIINYFIGLLEQFDYVSYPTLYSPNEGVHSEYDYRWASTRFFMCKRSSLDFTEIKKCLDSSEYLYDKYPASARSPWTEHVLGLIAKYNGKGVFYPPRNDNEYLIFCWGKYEQWTLRRLNELSYDEVKNYIHSKGGIQHHCEVYL